MGEVAWLKISEHSGPNRQIADNFLVRFRQDVDRLIKVVCGIANLNKKSPRLNSETSRWLNHFKREHKSLHLKSYPSSPMPARISSYSKEHIRRPILLKIIEEEQILARLAESEKKLKKVCKFSKESFTCTVPPHSVKAQPATQAAAPALKPSESKTSL